MMFTVIGIHPVYIPVPCHLVEVEFSVHPVDIDWCEITQEIDGQSRENWQVPWDEHPMKDSYRR